MEVSNQEDFLLNRLKQHDEAALKELVCLYQPAMILEAYYILKDFQEAEDIVQEVWIRFWQLRATIELKPSLAAYLQRATRNESIIYLKKKNVRAKRQAQYDYFLEPSIRLQPFENEELGKRLHHAINAIPPAARKSFILSYLDDKNQKAIATEQNISLQVVKNNISKALKILRQVLHTSK
ncbi:RNA polymerase sigma factor [Chitinophaga silvisoli]|uniref:Sigma-70 family RNA polymerase sigma factor n=1 Tax=Chitinophaga silvisoli TaxID=2291814 RepID=A0A3E1P3V0_9BACT|nr:sigma-70 family RNA polymerase sigma factor [Chitinophaga silvisoli]RFM34678.1 hypothetical protein DXN04_15550 [Chitinophaga silvisoli]